MLIVVFICALLTLFYLVLMMAYRLGWRMQPTFILPDNYKPQTTISIIIPARNEAENIEACIQSILAQAYPAALFEIIVIDDHSTDGTAEIVKKYTNKNVRYLSIASYLESQTLNSYKKKALDIGIRHSTCELIITTDADCIVPPLWLQHIAAMYETLNPVMIIAPVDYTCNYSLLQVFQSIDFMAMQGITAATHLFKLGNMGNGANLAFTREAYHTVNGYEGIEHLASGDDYLLMMKMQKAYKGGVAYLKSPQAIVRTTPQPDWSGFIQQRIRWSSKSGKYGDKRMTAVLLFVYLFNVALLVTAIAAIFFPKLRIVPIEMLLLKTMFELYFLIPVSAFFGKRKQLLVFVFLQPIHVLYILSAGFLGLVGVYKWKGRVVR